MVKQQSLKESSFVKRERAQIKSNINDGRNANKLKLFALFRLAKRWLVRCTKPRQPALTSALNENFNLPYGSQVKKHDTRLLIGRIAFLTCGKSNTRHLIGLHRFANENLLCGFSVCKSQYIYNKAGYSPSSFFYLFMDRDGVEVHKLAKNERGQYPAILTEKAWSI